MQVAKDIKMTFCQSCVNHGAQIYCLWTEKNEFIKTKNTFGEQINQLHLNTEILRLNSQNVENGIKAIQIKHKWKNHENVFFQSATRSNSDIFLATFEFLITRPQIFSLVKELSFMTVC